MKRFLALFLVCCLIVSALSVPAFAADSIVGRKWSCSTTGKTITVGSSDSLSYVFDASLGMNGFGSSPIENIYSSFPGWSGIKRSTSSLYTLPAGSTISYSVTISVSGFSGFGSSDLKPLGRISVCSVTDSGGWQSSVASSSSITPVISSGAYLYSFSGTVTLKDYVKTYAASLFFVFNLTGRTNNPINGKRLTCTVSSSDIFVKYLAGASSASEDQINSTVNNIYNTVTIKQNTTESVKLLGDILEELKKVEAENAETNDRLKGIQDAIDGFEINVSNAADKVLTGGDQKGLGALVSKLINHLLSIVDFVTDLFGGIFTSIPSTISAYNDCNTFWGDQKTYIYTPHQLSGYTGQGGNSYENSNDSVQKLFAEAEKYLGYPYVFGGSSPETSFDCSGFVCYALNHSGVYSIGRTTAQGLYDACTPVDRFDAKPGDLVFFTGTYDCADTVSHVGIYAGDGKMLHCGDPIQYTSIDTSYWQAHFYAFGRLSYNVDLVRPYFVSLHSSSSWDREWSNIYEVYVTDSDGSSINFSMNRDMAVITICQYDYSDSKWWAYTSVSASDNYTLSTASLPVRQYNSEGKPYLICAYIKDSDGVLVCSKPIAVIDPRYYSGTFSQLKFVQTYSCFPGSNIWPSTFYGGVDSE